MTTAFHRLARETPQYAWWKLPVAGLIAVTGYFAVIMVLFVLVIVGVFAAGKDGDAFLDRWFEASTALELSEPGYFALTMISIIVMLPAILLAVLVTGPRPVGYLTSVEGRMRWRWLARMMVTAFVLFGVVLGVALAVDDGVRAPSINGRIVVALVLVLVLTPFQATAEEYVFRGYLLQLVGSWTRFASIPILVSVPIFVAGHVYNLWGLIDVGIFGLTVAWLTIRTGGLEAAIAAHVANNVVLLVVEALGMITISGEGGAIDLIPTILTSTFLLWWVPRAATKHGIVRTRAPIASPPPPPMPMWPPVPYAMYWWPPPQPVLPPPPPPAQVARVSPHGPAYPGELPEGWDR